MPTANDIILRPRFKIELNEYHESILNRFQDSKKAQSEFIVSRIDDHVFIKFPKHKQHFWSPQLHLEINDVDENSCVLHGLFGPNPTVWTFFMFVHFLVAGLFIAFGIWAYTNWTLKTSFALQISLMILMVLIWIGLYVAGSIGKATSKNEMLELRTFAEGVVNKSLN